MPARLTRFILRHSAQPHGPVGLMYHSVQPGRRNPDWPWAVSKNQFAEQLDVLAAEGYVTPTISELLTRTQPWPERTAFISFDDGYVDNIDACSELQLRGMRATWYIVSSAVGKTPQWPDDGRPAGRMLNASELCEMQAAGMEIGSHTVNHVRLTDVDDTRMMQELTDSKAALEAILGNAVNSFAYPYGTSDTRCAMAVKQAGYTSACTTQTGWALRDNDPFQVRRLTVFNTDTASMLARKLYLGSHDVRWQDIAGSGLRRFRKDRTT
ncbi:MAG: polysaccharide deacetylase family protein [Thiobacillus sp.]|nr:polysaccharide deacetylase family protein [Thiobacillus sp.]